MGNIVPATSYGRVVLTIKIDGKENDEINILAGNSSYDEVGDANAFKLKRIVWLDENKKAIESSTEEYNSYGAVIPFKARYARFGFVQVYTESVTSDNIKSAMNSNKVWIKIKSEAIITIDKSNFEAIPLDPIVVDGSYMHMDNFKTGNIYVEGEQGVVGTINTNNTGYGSIAAEFIGFTQGDTLKVKCTSPGYGNSDTCMRINRWCWFDDSWTKVGEAQRIGVNPPYEQAFTAPAGATKLRLSICNPWSRELTSQKCLSYVDSHDILIKTIRSNNNIQPVLGTKLS